MTHYPLCLWALIVAALLLSPGCDHGLEPPEVDPPGQISGTIQYVGSWPPADSVRDLRFVAMRFVPQDTADFLQLNRMAISERLAYGVSADTFTIDEVETGLFVYSGVAQNFDASILSWKPIGLVVEAGGLFTIESGTTTTVRVTVDFAKPPVFPPPDPSARR